MTLPNNKPLVKNVAKAIYEWQPSMDYNDVISLPSHDSNHLHTVHYEMMAKKAIQEVAKYLLEELGGDYAATGTHLYGHLLKQLEEIS